MDDGVTSSKYETNFGDRIKAAALAKQEALENFRAHSKADDPANAARRAAQAQARDAKRAAAELARRTRREDAKVKAEAAERDAAAAAEAQAAVLERERREQTESAANLELERKAARDKRYAARKAKK